MRERCRKAFDRGLQCILACQIDDEGVKSVWCAQHDTVTLLPAEGRPHELPSFCCQESASLLEFLMSIENPSKEVREAIAAAADWLDKHKIENKGLEDYTNAEGLPDRRIIDQPGNALWGRFVQLGGKTAKRTYKLFFKHLDERNKTRKQVYQGREYSYREADNARESYDPKRAYEPIYGIYKDTLVNLYYRFLYNYEETPAIIDRNGVPQRTSLFWQNRSKYQFLGNWCWEVIYGEFPMWQERVAGADEAAQNGWTQLTVTPDMLYNAKHKDYNMARLGTIKMSPTTHEIDVPKGMEAVRIVIHGFANSAEDEAVIKSVNGMDGEYVFPKKVYNPVYTTHVIDLSGAPAKDNVPFVLEGGQCCVVIRMYCKETKQN